MKSAVLYKGRFHEEGIAFTRIWAMPSPWTFSIPVIARFLERYVTPGKNNWLDPFSGHSQLAEYTNDADPCMPARYHSEALEFAEWLPGKEYAGVLFDPPYSARQISEHYKHLNGKATKLQTGTAFYEKVRSALCEKIRPGGYAISFGWNTNGFGKARGFKIIEIMAVAHGGSKNDTLITVEQKL